MNGQYLGVVCSDFSNQQIAYLVYRQNFRDMRTVTIKGVTADGMVMDEMTVIVPANMVLSNSLDLDAIQARFTTDTYAPYGPKIMSGLLRIIPMNRIHSQEEYESCSIDLASMSGYSAPVLYVALNRLVSQVSLTTFNPLCNTRVSGLNWWEQSSRPVIGTVGGVAHIAEQNGIRKCYWCDGKGSRSTFKGVMTPGNTYYIYCEMQTDWGYSFDPKGVTWRVVVSGVEQQKSGDAISHNRNDCAIIETRCVHKDQTAVERQEPTCTENGMAKYYCCTQCGTCYANTYGAPTEIPKGQETAQLMLPALGHDWTDWSVTLEATEEKNGEQTRTCQRCGEIETRPVIFGEHEHSLSYLEARNADCTEQGSTGCWVCDICGSYFSDEGGTQEIAKEDALTPALGHIWRSLNAVWSDDDSTVTAYRVCLRDHSHDESETAAIVEAVLQQPTCTEAGILQRSASFENEGLSVPPVRISLPELGHDWTLTEVMKEPTCVEPGRGVFVCSRDPSHTKTDVIPATGHTPGAAEIVSDTATCEKNGTRTWETRCTVCGELLSTATEDSPAHGHAWGEATYTWEEDNSFVLAQHYCTYNPSHGESQIVAAAWVEEPATCEEYGLRGWFSEPFDFDGIILQEKDVEILEPLGHDWGEWVVTLEPRTSALTGQIHGQETRNCQRNPEHQEKRVLPAPGHQHTLTAVAAVSPTCEEAGSIAHWICSGSGLPCFRYFADAEGTAEIEIQDTVIAPLGHEWSEWQEDLHATCSEEGYDVRTCLHDASHHEYRKVDPDPNTHVWASATIHRKASATEAGSKTLVCALNEAHTETVEIPMLTVTAPEAKLLYLNGEAQELIVPGAASSGEGFMRYALGNADGPTEGYTDTVPTAAEAGIYTVWYMVPEDDEHVQWGPEKLISYIVPAFDTADLILPAQITKIEEGAFEGDSLIRSVDARSCAAIGKYAFKGCESLTKIKLSKDCALDPAAFEPGATVFVYAPAGGATETSCAGIANCVFVPVE